MTVEGDAYAAALERAAVHAREWLASVPDRPVPPQATPAQLRAALGGPVPRGPTAPEDVVDELVTAVTPGLMTFGSGRFYGWVVGGTQPAPLAADWLVSAWDQNTGMYAMAPGVAVVEEVAGRWLLELLGLPRGSDVGFVTGATSANLTCLAAARGHVLARAGWDVERDGLAGAPRVRVLVGEERHVSVDLALRYLGLGQPTVVPADDQGRVDVTALGRVLAEADGPTIVCLQAGNLHSGAFDAVGQVVDLTRPRHAWVHVDGAFGLWAAAAQGLRHLVDGIDRADSWATDAHKTLNVPYDAGVAVVADPAPLRRAMGVHAAGTAYLADFKEEADPVEKTPEMSRRARGVPVWAALRSLGRDGVADLVERLARHARALADGVSGVPGARVVNDVVYTQVCVSFGDDARTRRVTERLLADGEVWMSGSRWCGVDVLRISVSSWSTDEDDVARSVEAVRRAASGH